MPQICYALTAEYPLLRPNLATFLGVCAIILVKCEYRQGRCSRGRYPGGRARRLRAGKA